MTDWHYGKHTVLEILKSNQPVVKVLIAKGVENQIIDQILPILQSKRIAFEWISKHSLDTLIKGNHQGIALEMETPHPIDFKSFLNHLKCEPHTFVTLLDEIQDPQNLGAIIRSAVCFGCSGVILPKWNSAGLTPAVMRASSGAVCYCPIVQIANLNVAIERLKENGFFVIGADPSDSALSLQAIEFKFPLAIVLGNEHSGLKNILKKSCDQLVKIPQLKSVASLNVSNAAAIFFYEASIR